MTRAESNIVLMSITLCWASSYIFVKNLTGMVSGFAYLTLTTGLASLILGILFFKKLRQFNRSVLLHAFALAVILIINAFLERLGLVTLEASTASFVASLNILFVPLLLLLAKKPIGLNSVGGILLILPGVAITSGIQLGNRFQTGVLYMILATISMSLYIIMAGHFATLDDTLLLGIGQMFFSFLLAFICWSAEEPRTFFSLHYTNSLLANIFLLAFFSKAYAYIMLIYSQKYASPVSVTVIASTEPVVTMVLAILLPGSFSTGEVLSQAKLTGAGLIVAGSIVANLDFLNELQHRLHQKKHLRGKQQGASS